MYFIPPTYTIPYPTAAFVKIFQTGEGDYWAYAKDREKRGLPISLFDWVRQVLMGRDGRALRHPRFFYFAVNTALHNKAVRGKSYFVRPCSSSLCLACLSPCYIWAVRGRPGSCFGSRSGIWAYTSATCAHRCE